MKNPLPALAMCLLTGCGLSGTKREPIPLVPSVDLARFMGDWYEIGFIPIKKVRDAHNGVETYSMNADGSIATVYRYRDGGFDEPLELMTPTGFVRDGSNNALWGMRLVWPFKSEYRIVYLDADYAVTIIARNARDYVWLMAREPQMNDAEFDRYRSLIAGMGYDMTEFKRQPQRWPEAQARPVISNGEVSEAAR